MVQLSLSKPGFKFGTYTSQWLHQQGNPTKTAPHTRTAHFTHHHIQDLINNGVHDVKGLVPYKLVEEKPGCNVICLNFSF